jgi:hypothetical protein
VGGSWLHVEWADVIGQRDALEEAEYFIRTALCAVWDTQGMYRKGFEATGVKLPQTFRELEASA